MKRHLTKTLLTVTLLAAAVPARAQTGGAQPPPRPAASAVPADTPDDHGRLEGGTYTNGFFGVSFTVPQGWVAQDLAAKQRILDMGKEVVSEGAPEKKAEGIEASLKRTYFLLSVSKYDLTRPPPGFNALMMCMAERVPTAVIKTGEDYIASMIRITEGTAAKIELTGPLRTERVGGVPFTVADAKLLMPSGSAAQKYYVMVKNGYAFTLGYSYVDEADAKAFADVIKSVKFK
ncbi:MAG TPA: hypothetical protein VF570_04540 [Pyrinomonadaceae bacterium]|jgi:hypothetical protein